MKNIAPNIYSLLFTFLLFLVPVNLFYVVNESAGYVNGMRIDYLLVKIFVSDLVLISTSILGLWMLQKTHNLPKKSVHTSALLVTLVVLATVQLVTDRSVLGLLWLIRWTALGSIVYVTSKLANLMKTRMVFIGVALTVVFQFLVALSQFLTQQAVFPSYAFFGETRLDTSVIGISRASFFGEERLLAYGTTSHPNVLAGVLVLYVLVLLPFFSKHRLVQIAAILVALCTLVITQSMSALLALVCGLVLLYGLPSIKTMPAQRLVHVLLLSALSALVFLLLIASMIDHPSISRRVALNDAAMVMIAQFPITGSGVGQFTAYLEKYLPSKELIRFLQPAHNVPLLFVAETGLVGVLLALALYVPLTARRVPTMLIATIPILVMDHYLYTHQTGMLLLGLFTALLWISGNAQEEKTE